MATSLNRLFLLLIIFIATGCANIVPPTGGKKDVTPPKLMSATPADSLLNKRINKLILRFDEYITVSDASKEVQISPILPIPLTVNGLGKKVTVKIPDTLLQDNTTYRISFGNAIKDLHEGNAFKGYTYTFSTGGYFDSLQLDGKVLNAVTGLPDTGTVYVVLYNASKSDSAVVREKPLYITTCASDGSFSFKGLPKKIFRIYALKDANGNLIYDGGKEWIGFLNKTVTPGDTAVMPDTLRIFQEIPDTARQKTESKPGASLAANATRKESAKNKEGFTYTVDADTTDTRKRTQEIISPVTITFNKPLATIAKERVTLTYDSAGIAVSAPFEFSHDTIRKNVITMKTGWQENMVYTLRLLKGFAKDSAGADAMPSRYSFRTKRDEDYGKLHIHLPVKYNNKEYVLLVKNERDTVYNSPITDTLINLVRLRPATYTMLIIVDKNGNGKWDTGNLFKKIQPEYVIPHPNNTSLKAGWEDIIDFEQKDKGKGRLKDALNKSGTLVPNK